MRLLFDIFKKKEEVKPESKFFLLIKNLIIVMNNSIFNLVADGLLYIGRKTRLTYNEINIIVYFFIIPFSWLILLDIIFHFHVLKIAFLFYCLGFRMGCRNFKEQSDWLFDKSVSFLCYFDKFGSNYTKSSVLICVSVPILIYVALFVIDRKSVV